MIRPLMRVKGGARPPPRAQNCTIPRFSRRAGRRKFAAMSQPPDHERELRLYVLERNVHHLGALLANEQDRLKAGVLRTLLESAKQDLQRFKRADRAPV